MAATRRAIISVSDKRFITTFARDLAKFGYEIISTGGTFTKLKQAQVPCKEIARVYAAPSMLDGRVKTLHPALMAGILADRHNPEHIKEMKAKKFNHIDMVVVNFYPFDEKVKSKTSLEQAVELVDIGGPSMVRAAAKNYRSVAVISDVEQYRTVIRLLKEHDGELPEEYRLWLASEVFKRTAAYDTAIAAYFGSRAPEQPVEDEAQAAAPAVPANLIQADVLPGKFVIELNQAQKLRYGENPHQNAARYNVKGLPMASFKVLQGKEMSYNNYLDASAVMDAISAQYSYPCVAVVMKHLNPCGIAVGKDPVKTLVEAREADAKSAFGGIVGVNYNVDEAMAEEIRRTFLELVVAPSFSPGAMEKLSSKLNLRLVQVGIEEYQQIQRVSGRLVLTQFGGLMQEHDIAQEDWSKIQQASVLAPPESLHEDILLGLTYIRFLKSNSLCVVKGGTMVGRGVGQMSRVDATEQALASAGTRAKGAVLISDGFFPFADSLELAAKAKIGCVVAPAGSKRDMEVVSAADKLNLPLLFAPYRHFRH
jgi:phosphoribosylaminoimidazolecarboxamide formyltransferase / IMP cyclohydrolase